LKKRFEIKILGQELSVTSDSGDEHVANVIRYVSEKVDEAGKVAVNRNALNIVILAALNIADEYLRMNGTIDNIYSQLESRSEQLINLINDSR
jgi:cell division protein ZapA